MLKKSCEWQYKEKDDLSQENGLFLLVYREKYSNLWVNLFDVLLLIKGNKFWINLESKR